ncbi:MAG: hypothetical protein ACPG5W_06045 [Flavobacteriales bacterium]
MKNILSNTVFTCLFLLSITFAQADIGETHTLKTKRVLLLNQIEELSQDSTTTNATIDSLRVEVLNLDTRIFVSYEETIDRVAAQKLRQNSSNRSVVYLALGVSLIALFFAIMLFALRSRVKENENVGLRQFYKELSIEFAGKVSADKTASNRMLRVNIVVVAGLILMSASILAFLVRSL